MATHAPSARPRRRALAALASLGVALVDGPTVHAAEPTSGFPEPVIHWVVQKGETCKSVAEAVYGQGKFTYLLGRYTRVRCGGELPEGQTLVLPASPTSLPDAKLRSMNPNVEGKPAGGAWGAIATGASLYSNHAVQTKETGRADIEFVDRTRIFLADNTLVVLYGTAARTSVKKNAPPAVELDRGEVRAGLAALRGEPVDVGVKGGGSVSAASRDTVVERKGERTTVAVFDGKAEVKNGGKKVEVPTHFGTRFVGQRPPEPPRPLPPAPEWKESSPELVMTTTKAGSLAASWGAVPKARAYRFEISRDPDFRDLFAREEVSAKVTSFRAESLPPGRYYVSVRAIDDEDFLGIAARRGFAIVPATVVGGRLTPDALFVTPYTRLELGPGVEVALDEGPFSTLSRLAFATRTVRALRVRFASAEASLPVREGAVSAELSGSLAGERLTVSGTVLGLDEGVAELVRPQLRVHLADGPVTQAVEIEGNGFRAALSVPGGERRVRIDVLDGAGRVLGSTEVVARSAEQHVQVVDVPRIGLLAPLVPVSQTSSFLPWSPTAYGAGSLSLSAANAAREGRTSFQGHARAMGGVGAFGFDAALTTRQSGDRIGDEAAGLGVRLRTLRRGLAELEHGVALRAFLPTEPGGSAARVEPSTALGGARGKGTWLVGGGARFRLESAEERGPTPRRQAFVFGQATWDPVRDLRVAATFDGALVALSDGTKTRGGLSLGVEGGRRVFGGLGLRASPRSDGIGFTGFLALGLRP